jgi:DNA-3-methyladenine glycosylase II
MDKIVNQNDIKKLKSKDKLFGRIYNKYGFPPNWTRPPGFISLIKIILSQQISLASADAHFLKLKGYVKRFAPSEILKLSDEEMRKCQISRQKSKYLRALSSAIINKDIDLKKLKNLNESEIREHLTKIKGIGNWTADCYLIFCLQAKDIFPVGDIAIINTIKELTNAKAIDAIILRSDKWRPLRSLATFSLWHYYLKKRNKIML